MKFLPQLVICLATSISPLLSAQGNRIDMVRDDAPDLAQFGDYDIGVRTFQLLDKNRIDVLNTPRGGDTAFYDRLLTLEIWYPADLNGGEPGTQYQAVTRNPEITATLHGRAVRDAAENRTGAPYPLVIISHGYPGNRFLLSHLGENLASKGYVVVSIDHTESTYDDQQGFQSTLYNRPLDQRFVLQSMAEISGAQPGRPFSGMISTDKTGIVGYSMGGYGLVNNLGGGYSDDIVGAFMAPPNELLKEHATGNPGYRSKLDSRIVAGVAIAPWGMNTNFWRPSDLAGITVPTFYVAGSADTVAGYENGTRAIFENAVNSDRYLLTFENANHNAGAPIPVPQELLDAGDTEAAAHYTDPNWDTVLMNNIMDHYITAWFAYHLKGNQAALPMLSELPRANSERLRLEHLTPGQ